MQQLTNRVPRTQINEELLAFPGEERYEEARRAFNLAADQHPDVIALPRTVKDVIEAVRIARAAVLRVAPQRTGHGATVLPSLQQAMLLRTDLMSGVELQTESRLARVSAGTQWEQVVRPASRHRLGALHGSAPDVGVIGYSLGGGLSWYGRKHGLAANHVSAIELVTPDGRYRRVTRDTDPDLFWALRGGGGNFGVVTAMEFELIPVPQLYAGALFFDWRRSEEVLHAWRAWILDVPDELTSVGRILQFPALPQLPEPLRGNAFVLVEAAYLGSEADGVELLEPLRRLGPAIDTFRACEPADIAELHMDPTEPIPGDGDHQLLGSLPAKAIDEIVDITGPGSDSPLLSFELRHLGGALSREHPDNGALGIVRGAFSSFGAGMTADADSARAVRERLDALAAALQGYACDYALPNFTLQAQPPSLFFDEATLSRLRQVRERVDPDRLIVSKHAV